MKRFLLACLLVVGASACGSPAGPSPFTQTINGSIGSFGYQSHDLTAPRAGTLTVLLRWEAGNSRDLDLYLTATSCEDIYGLDPCVFLAESILSEGTSEVVSRVVQSGEALKIWVDSFSTSNHGYSLDVTIE
jgi:hypothetical protein